MKRGNVLTQSWRSKSEIPLSSDGIIYFAGAVGRQRAIHTENNGFASPTLGQHISTFHGYRILFSIRNPYIWLYTTLIVRLS
jgi:hypothetical protein